MKGLKHRRSATGAVALALCVVLCGAAGAQDKAADTVPPTLQKIRSTGVLVIGHRVDALPFSYLDADKRPIGYGIDVCSEIVAILRKELKAPIRVEYVPVTAANRIQIVNSGKADMECGLTVNNPERRKESGYALPYYFAGPRILTRTDSGIRDFTDLGGKRVVSAKGANAVPIMKKRMAIGTLPFFQLTEVGTNTEAFAALEKGEADAYVTTDNLLYSYRANSANPDRYHVVGSFLVIEPVAILLRKDDGEFKAAVDRALAGLMLDGVVGRLYSKWFLSPVPPKGITIGIPMSNVLRDQLRWPTDHAGG